MTSTHVSLALIPLLLVGCCKTDPDATSSESSSGVSSPGAPDKPGAAQPGATQPGATQPGATAPTATGKLMGSCMIASVACSDYYGSGNSDILKAACQMAGKWSDSACPTAGVKGTCTKPEPGGIVNKTHTYAPGTPETAKTACGNTPGGVFTP